MYERFSDILEREVFRHTNSKHSYEDWKEWMESDDVDLHTMIRFLKGELEEMHALLAEVVESEI